MIEQTQETTDKLQNWLIFGVGSPEPRFLGSYFNVGAAVVDLLADQAGMQLKEAGPIRSCLFQTSQARVRLIKPNVVPELASLAVLLAKNHCRFDPNCVALIYGDNSYSMGSVKIKRKGGLSGNKVIGEFNSTFGQKSVVRIRVGLGVPKSKRDGNSSDSEATSKLLRGLYIAADVVRMLTNEGYAKASDLANKASKGLPT